MSGHAEESSELVRLSRSPDGAARLTLTRSARRNAISAPLAEQFVAAVREIEEWDVHVAILDAEGPAFCAGADLSDLAAGGRALDDVVAALTTGAIHWTAVVNGAVRGGGLSILAECPRVIATPESSFGLPEIGRGFFPEGVIHGQVELMGARRAFDLALRGTPIDAAEALASGLISSIVDADRLDAYVADASALLLAIEPAALREGVELWHERKRTSGGR